MSMIYIDFSVKYIQIISKSIELGMYKQLF
jgi:hypothetical protein